MIIFFLLIYYIFFTYKKIRTAKKSASTIKNLFSATKNLLLLGMIFNMDSNKIARSQLMYFDIIYLVLLATNLHP